MKTNTFGPFMRSLTNHHIRSGKERKEKKIKEDKIK